MKIILVDAIGTFIDKEKGVFDEMYRLLQEYPNKKIIMTGADDEQIEKFHLDNVPYEFFTLKHNPEKTNPEYFNIFMKKFSLKVGDLIYFEHDKEAVKTAQSLGIKTFYYDENKKNLEGLKIFLDENL